MLERISADLNQRLAENEKTSSVSMEDDPLAGIAGNADAEAIWWTLPLDRQRAIIRDLCDVTLYRPRYTPNQYSTFEPDSVQIDWRR